MELSPQGEQQHQTSYAFQEQKKVSGLDDEAVSLFGVQSTEKSY
jgi:hypothetical protein